MEKIFFFFYFACKILPMGSSKCSEKSPPRTARPDMMQPVTSKGRKIASRGEESPSPRYFLRLYHQPKIANSSAVNSRTFPHSSVGSSCRGPIATRFRNNTFFPARSHILLT